MGHFQRSPSKVWWSNEDSPNSLRSASASPRSQDSGFSDAETSPGNVKVKDDKENSGNEKKIDNERNLSSSIREKQTPKKSIDLVMLQNQRLYRTKQIRLANCGDLEWISTPVCQKLAAAKTNTEPQKINKNRNEGEIFKVNRNLFEELNEERNATDQYSKRVTNTRCNSNVENDSYETVCYLQQNENSFKSEKSSQSENSFNLSDSATTLPLYSPVKKHRPSGAYPENLSAPAVLCQEELKESTHEAVTSFDESDSELEHLFGSKDTLDSPKHTSTPKNLSGRYLRFRGGNEMKVRDTVVEENWPLCVNYWLKELVGVYDPECMSTLQCKSIIGELMEKVNHLASDITGTVRDLLGYFKLVEEEFGNIKNQRKHIRPLTQSLVGIIIEFLNKYAKGIDTPLYKQCEMLKINNNYTDEDLSKILTKCHQNWKSFHKKLLSKEIKILVEELEDPSSEMQVRALLTGLTSIALRNEDLISMISSAGAVQYLCVLCEKCEGSSVRSLTLRALTTICTDAWTIRQFERASGVQVITDVLTDKNRPEAERSEAVALLAQITAPWIEDNHNVKGLSKHDKSLVEALTWFTEGTRCCQNLLLCAAALANLTTMDNNSIRYLLDYNTVQILLEAVKKRGSRASVYLLEQVATVVANVSMDQRGRKLLTKHETPIAMMCFLQSNNTESEIVKRLQQKSIIALSRLCSEKIGAEQVVQMGGVSRLVQLCREKKERFDSDAVLVAALATLRKIAEVCGKDVISRQDSQELVEPRLLDSFLAYSTQNESYV